MARYKQFNYCYKTLPYVYTCIRYKIILSKSLQVFSQDSSIVGFESRSMIDLALCINVTEEHPSGHSGWAVLHLLPPGHLAEPELSSSKRYLASCQLLHL